MVDIHIADDSWKSRDFVRTLEAASKICLAPVRLNHHEYAKLKQAGDEGYIEGSMRGSFRMGEVGGFAGTPVLIDPEVPDGIARII